MLHVSILKYIENLILRYKLFTKSGLIYIINQKLVEKGKESEDRVI